MSTDSLARATQCSYKYHETTVTKKGLKMSVTMREAERRKLAKAPEAELTYGKIAVYRFISAFEMLKAASKPEKPPAKQKPA